MNALGNVKLQVWLMIVMVFALGGVTGAAIDRLFLPHGVERFESNRAGGPGGPGGPGGRGGGMIKRMSEELSLSDEQAKSIKAIFDDSRKQFKMDDCPGFKEARLRTQARIRDVLTPEQQKKFDEHNAKREAEMNRAAQ